MFNKVFFYSLALALLLSNSGMQLMGCVADPGHQACHFGQSKAGEHACHHLACKHGHGGAAQSRKATKNSAEPLACLQACSASLLSLQPQGQVQFKRPNVSLPRLATLAHVFIPSSEPRSIFHPPA